MPASEDIEALVARAQSGDVRAFETLIADHQAVVRRFARAFAASDADADDLAQEALIKVYRSIRQFRYQSAFSSWLYTIARRVFLDAAKSRAGQERGREDALSAEHVETLATDSGTDAHLLQEEERERVWRGLRRLPVEYRTALVLFDIEGRSYDELATIEGVPVGTIKSRLSRGRAQLKVLLAELDEEQSRVSEAPGTNAGQASSHLRRSGS